MEEHTTRGWCQILGMQPPKLEAVVGHREANTFALLLVALLERDAPMTLSEVAVRFEQAGAAGRSAALLSLKRCKPGRAPVYREGELYHLDPHDEDLDLWVFRLGLRPAKAVLPPPPVFEAAPLLGPDMALTPSELDEAWHDASLSTWSAQRVAVAVLDAGSGPMTPAEVVAAVAARTRWHPLRELEPTFKRRNSAVAVLEDGRWAIAAEAEAAVQQARSAVRDRIVMLRRYRPARSDLATVAQRVAEAEERHAANAAALASLSRALLVAFPPARPVAVALLDIGAHEITTFVGEELRALPVRLAAYDLLGAIEVRALLRTLGFDPGARPLAELGPPQKTKKLNQRGRTLQITTALLVQGTCGISKPFGDEAKLAEYLAKGQVVKLRRRLEADVKSLHALYEYGRLHGTVRLRWGFLDEAIAAPWGHSDDLRLYRLMASALASEVPLQVVTGTAPGWEEPWSRGRIAFVVTDERGWRTWLVDEQDRPIADVEVQRARRWAGSGDDTEPLSLADPRSR
jgi:hypothetical protein